MIHDKISCKISLSALSTNCFTVRQVGWKAQLLINRKARRKMTNSAASDIDLKMHLKAHVHQEKSTIHFNQGQKAKGQKAKCQRLKSWALGL